MLHRVMFRRRKQCREYMLENERACLPILGNALAAGFGPDGSRLRAGVYYMHFREPDGEPDGVCCMVNDGNLMVYTRSDQAVGAFSQLVQQWRFHTLWGFGMSRKQTCRLMENLPEVRYTCQPHYLLQQTCCPEDSGVPMQFLNVCDQPDKPVVTAFIQQVLRECFGHSTPPHIMLRRTLERRPEEVYLVGIAENHMVSQSHIQAWGVRYAHIGGVGTLKACRGKGYAYATVHQLCQYIINRGRIPTLTVHCDNQAALDLYKRLGFEIVEPVWVLEC